MAGPHTTSQNNADPRIVRLGAQLQGVVNAQPNPAYRHTDIGKFIEMMELAAGACVDKPGQFKAVNWAKHLSLHPYFGDLLRALTSARNLGAHANRDADFLTAESAERDLTALLELLPHVAAAFTSVTGRDYAAQLERIAADMPWHQPAPAAARGRLRRVASVAGVALVGGLVWLASTPQSSDGDSPAPACVAPVAPAATRGAPASAAVGVAEAEIAPEVQALIAAAQRAGLREPAPPADPANPADPADPADPAHPADPVDSADVGATARGDDAGAADRDIVEVAVDAEPSDVDATQRTADNARAAALRVTVAALQEFVQAAPTPAPTSAPRSFQWTIAATTTIEDALDAEQVDAALVVPWRRTLAHARVGLLERCCSARPMTDCPRRPLKMCGGLAKAAAQATNWGALDDRSAAQGRLLLRLAEELERPVRVAASRARPNQNIPTDPHVLPRSWLPGAAAQLVLPWAKRQRRGTRWGIDHWPAKMPMTLVLWRRAAAKALAASSILTPTERARARSAGWRALTTWVWARYAQRDPTSKLMQDPHRREGAYLAPAVSDDLVFARGLERANGSQVAMRQASVVVAALTCVLDGRNCLGSQ